MAKSKKSTKKAKTTKAGKTTKSAKATKSSKTTESSKSTKAADTAKSTKAEESAKTTKSTESKGSAKTEKLYSLRNDAKRTFAISAEVTSGTKAGTKGAEIKASISEGEGKPFTYVVKFSDEFCATKKNFTPDMFLHTAISIMEAQIESKKHVDTLLEVHRHSGLIDTQPLNA